MKGWFIWNEDTNRCAVFLGKDAQTAILSLCGILGGGLQIQMRHENVFWLNNGLGTQTVYKFKVRSCHDKHP